MEAAEFGNGFRRGGKRFPVGGIAVVDLHHLLADHVLVITLGVVEHIADFVLVNPAEFAVEQRVVGVVVERLVADEFNSALHPAPAVDGRSVGDGDVVCHVPREIGGCAGELRLKFGDP